MWIFPWITLSWHSCYMWDKLGWLNWFWQFLCGRFSSFNLKGLYCSYALSCSLCERRTSFCTGLISRKLYGFLLRFSAGFTSLIVLLLFPLLITFFICITVCDSILSNINMVHSVNPSVNVFAFEDVSVHHKDWLTYSDATDRPGELYE